MRLWEEIANALGAGEEIIDVPVLTHASNGWFPGRLNYVDGEWLVILHDPRQVGLIRPPEIYTVNPRQLFINPDGVVIAALDLEIQEYEVTIPDGRMN